MQQERKIALVWAAKELNTSPNTGVQVIRDLIFPNMITEKSLFVHAAGIEDKISPANRLFQGDNLAVMHFLLNQGYGDSIDLIYIDPPYMSAGNYYVKTTVENQGRKQVLANPAFADTWNYDIENYLAHIHTRLKVMYQLLQANGSIFVHLDWHISHYVKILLDEIFSPQALINEIIWCYSGGSGQGRHFQRKHDVIFWYAKGRDYIFNPQYRPYTEGTMQRGLTRVKGDKYKLNEKGAKLQDWWMDINKILSPTAYENLKFPTQKPINLIKRIIAAASDPGSLVADFYAGSGTTAEACEQMNRNWICCDSGKMAVETALNRLIKKAAKPFTLETADISDSNAFLGAEARIVQESDGEMNVSININDYKPQVLPQDFKYDNPAVLINFWEIDLDHHGSSFCSHIQVFRQTKRIDDSLCLDIIVRIPAAYDTVLAVRVHDIWGDKTTRVIRLRR